MEHKIDIDSTRLVGVSIYPKFINFFYKIGIICVLIFGFSGGYKQYSGSYSTKYDPDLRNGLVIFYIAVFIGFLLLPVAKRLKKIYYGNLNISSEKIDLVVGKKDQLPQLIWSVDKNTVESISLFYKDSYKSIGLKEFGKKKMNYIVAQKDILISIMDDLKKSNYPSIKLIDSQNKVSNSKID